MSVNAANKAAKPNADKNADKAAADKAAPTFVETLIEQITELGADRRMSREINAFVRYQLAGLSRSLIDCEVSAKVIGTPDADKLVSEIATAINAVAKKTEDKDASALLRRFAKVFESDYACVRNAALRRAR